jgi:hypothetical protein
MPARRKETLAYIFCLVSFASSWTFLPPAETSLPAPSIVLQALINDTTAMLAKPNTIFFHMTHLLMIMRKAADATCVGNSNRRATPSAHVPS